MEGLELEDVVGDDYSPTRTKELQQNESRCQDCSEREWVIAQTIEEEEVIR